MATVDGLTKDRMLAIEAASVVDGDVVGDNLILTKHDGSTIDAGNVRGPTGSDAADPTQWTPGDAYITGNVVAYSGILWKARANNTGKPPHLFGDMWGAIEGLDYSTTWAQRDAYFTSNDLSLSWEFFWHTGTSVCSITTTAGEFESGDQALKVAMGTSASQTIHTKYEENIVRGGEVVNVVVRAKLRVAAAGATISAFMYQNDATGNPGPFASGLSTTQSNEGAQTLTTAWKTYAFTINAVNGKSRAVAAVGLGTGANAADVLIDWITFSRQKQSSITLVNTPVGATIAWPSNTIPAGWALADGSAISRAAYPEYFALVGTVYGAGDGSTTFNLPNLLGRIPVGKWSGDSRVDTLGKVPGAYDHVLTAAQQANMQVYSGDGYPIWSGLGNGLSGYYLPNANNNGLLSGGPFNSAYAYGGGQAHNNIQPSTVFNWIVRIVASAGVDKTSVQFFKGRVPPATGVTFTGGANMNFTDRIDPSNAWNSTNKEWVCPQPGRYRITVSVKSDGGTAIKSLKIVKNGSTVVWGADSPAQAFAGSIVVDTLELLPGDRIAVVPVFTFTSCSTDGAGVENTYLIIESVGLEGTPTGLADTGWIAIPALQNGWTQYGGWEVAAYRKLNGVVFLKGLLTPGTTTPGTLITTLPVGFRNTGPSHTEVASGTATGAAVNIFNDGRIQTNYNIGGGWLSLNNISYPADN